MRNQIVFLTIILFLCVAGGVAAQYKYLKKPLPVLRIDLKASVRFDPARHAFLYSYSILNKPESNGRVASFRIDISRPPGGAVLTRTGLRDNPDVYAKNIAEFSYAKLGDTIVPVGFEDAPEGWSGSVAMKRKASFILGRSIKPGETLGGFVLSSKVLPGIREVTVGPLFDLSEYFPGAETLAPNWDAVAQLGREVRQAQEDIKVRVDSVGPSPQSPDIPTTFLLDHVVSQKEQAFRLGWIDNEGVANSLNKKLAHAKRRLSEGMPIPAVNVLHAFIHELQAQQGKHVNDNAFYLLKANAEFLIFKIETR